MAKLKWKKQLQTPLPLDLNDNIFQEGNISKDSNIDIFFQFLTDVNLVHMEFVKTVKLNANKKCLTVADFNTILTKSGKHAMLS